MIKKKVSFFYYLVNQLYSQSLFFQGCLNKYTYFKLRNLEHFFFLQPWLHEKILPRDAFMKFNKEE